MTPTQQGGNEVILCAQEQEMGWDLETEVGLELSSPPRLVSAHLTKLRFFLSDKKC